MKFLWLAFVLALITSINAGASDQYYRAPVTWNNQIELKSNISVQSVIKLNQQDLILISKTYEITNRLFFKYWNSKQNKCHLGKLKIKIVRSHYDLSNYKYFPNESEYDDLPGEGTMVIFGRYYRSTNTLYVVPPNEQKYYWRRDFAHEVIHYLFDECNIKFSNDNVEHSKVYEFLDKHKETFN